MKPEQGEWGISNSLDQDNFISLTLSQLVIRKSISKPNWIKSYKTKLLL